MRELVDGMWTAREEREGGEGPSRRREGDSNPHPDRPERPRVSEGEEEGAGGAQGNVTECSNDNILIDKVMVEEEVKLSDTSSTGDAPGGEGMENQAVISPEKEKEKEGGRRAPVEPGDNDDDAAPSTALMTMSEEEELEVKANMVAEAMDPDQLKELEKELDELEQKVCHDNRGHDGGARQGKEEGMEGHGVKVEAAEGDDDVGCEEAQAEGMEGVQEEGAGGPNGEGENILSSDLPPFPGL